MIETDYQMSCDICAGNVTIVHSQDELGETTMPKFWKYLAANGWRRINAKDHCPDCVRIVSAECPPTSGEVRKPRQIKRLSKTAQDAFLSKQIDKEPDHAA